MNTAEFLTEHGYLTDYAIFATSIGNNMADVWDAIIAQKKYDWIVDTMLLESVFSDQDIIKMLCRLIREMPIPDNQTVIDLLIGKRAINAIEAGEKFAAGQITAKELKAAQGDARDVFFAVRENANPPSREAHAAAWCAITFFRDKEAFCKTSNAALMAGMDKDTVSSTMWRIFSEMGNPFRENKEKKSMSDNVNHPAHYEAGYTTKIECIDIARHLNFCRGNAFKYVWRCGKNGNNDQAIEDLEKAIWYLHDDFRYSDAKAMAVFSLINFPTSDMFETERYNALSAIIYNKYALIPIDAMKGILKNRLMEKKQNENC